MGDTAGEGGSYAEALLMRRRLLGRNWVARVRWITGGERQSVGGKTGLYGPGQLEDEK